MRTEVEYGGLPNCLKIANDEVELIIPTMVGPRILAYAFSGEENILGVWPELATATKWGQWKPWGGHRLWAAPEAMPRSYAPDNGPIAHSADSDLSLRLMQPVDGSGLEKQIRVSLGAHGSRVALVHTITNHSLWPVELAPWALTIMRAGGTAFVPLEPFRSHDEALLPSQPLVRWYFTDFSDSRWTLGRRFVRLRCEQSLSEPQKAGLMNRQGWCAYVLGSTVFIKQFEYEPTATYPDFGCNNEFYTAAGYIELESLGGMTSLEPGCSLQHVERWKLFRNIELGSNEDAIYDTLCRLVLSP